ncbi:AMP-dependent synthetase and ligase [Hyaloraphidium curvatum]|nr:AMP-dependent synthetase and ligase [Hyaloraphidium curvatum]
MATAKVLVANRSALLGRAGNAVASVSVNGALERFRTALLVTGTQAVAASRDVTASPTRIRSSARRFSVSRAVRQAEAAKVAELGPFGLKNDYSQIPQSLQSKPYRTELNPAWLLERAARIWPTNLAVVHEGRSYNYKEMNERVLRFASALRAMGLRKGDRVAYVCPNTPSILEGHFAVPLAGGVIICVNTRLKSEEISYIIKHSGARFAVVDKDLAHLKEEMNEWGVERVIIDGDTGIVGQDEYATVLSEAEPRTWWSFDVLENEDELISLCYTSGTTGPPKGVMHSYRQSFMEAIAQTLEMGFTTKTRYLWILPLFHANGWCIPWAVALMGGAHVCLRKVDYDLIWSYFTDLKITHYNGAPTVQSFLCANPNAKKLDHPMRVMVAGSPPSPALIKRMTELGMEVVHVYGMTETLGPAARCYPQESWDKYVEEGNYTDLAHEMAMQGQNYPMQDELRVVDENMNDVPADGQTMGEVIFRGNITMATAKAFKGGWLHSGDLAVREPNGYVALKDRQKDIVISGGENISTVEVENVIASHPKVLEVAVVPTPDDTWGERPKAFVVLKQEAIEHEQFAPGEIEFELIQHCRKHLAGFKIPARIQLEMELPKTATGKIRKNVLRDREWQAVGGRRIN